MTVLFSNRPLPDGLELIDTVPSMTGGTARIGVRHARAGDLVDAYPAGTHDRELVVEGDPTPAAVAAFAQRVLVDDVRCRRVVLPVPEGDVAVIGWAEDAGFRYVVDVGTRDGEYSLLVTEPDWVLAQPHVLDDIPLKE